MIIHTYIYIYIYIYRERERERAYLSISFSQMWYPASFRLFDVTALWSSVLPVKNTTLIPIDNKFRYSFRDSGNARASPVKTHWLNAVEL